MKKSLSLLLAILCASIFASAQTDGKVYTAKDIESQIASHESFAILPFDINYQQRTNKTNKLTKEEIDDMVENMSYETQNALFGFTMKKAGKGNLYINPQDPDVTNAILLKNNITHLDLKKYTPAELCEILEVDAVLGGTLTVKETMSQGAAAVTSVLVGFGKTNSGLGQIKLTDSDGDLLFNYNKKVATGLGGDSTDIIEKLMKKSANRFPYFTKSKNLLK